MIPNRLLLLLTLAGLLLLPMAGCDQPVGGTKALVDNAYGQITTGMNERQVLALMGEPDRRMNMPVEGGPQRQVIWRWLRAGRMVHVSFVDGQVLGKERH